MVIQIIESNSTNDQTRAICGFWDSQIFRRPFGLISRYKVNLKNQSQSSILKHFAYFRSLN